MDTHECVTVCFGTVSTSAWPRQASASRASSKKMDQQSEEPTAEEIAMCAAVLRRLKPDKLEQQENKELAAAGTALFRRRVVKQEASTKCRLYSSYESRKPLARANDDRPHRFVSRVRSLARKMSSPSSPSRMHTHGQAVSFASRHRRCTARCRLHERTSQSCASGTQS